MSEHRDFEFSLRELAGSMGDFGTLFPLVIGYIAVNGLDPAGLFIMLGLTNVAIGLVYRLPMPLQPKKVIAVAAIAQKWPPSRIYVSGLGLGVTWFILVFSGALRKTIELTPTLVVRGIQLALGVMLATGQAGPRAGLRCAGGGRETLLGDGADAWPGHCHGQHVHCPGELARLSGELEK